MKTYKILIVMAMISVSFAYNNLLRGATVNYDYAGESIQYLIKPVGKLEYNNLGTVDLEGVKANLVTLKSNVLFVNVMEKIFYDLESLLPYKAERTTSVLGYKEYRTEEYDQGKFTVVIKKFRGKKLVKEQVLVSDAPIQNVSLLLLYLRKQPGFKIGWQFHATVLDELKLAEFDLELLSIDEITVPAGTSQAYYFKSTPAKFEIWMDKSAPHVPLKIRLKSAIDCYIEMKRYDI